VQFNLALSSNLKYVWLLLSRLVSSKWYDILKLFAPWFNELSISNPIAANGKLTWLEISSIKSDEKVNLLSDCQSNYWFEMQFKHFLILILAEISFN